MTGAGDLTLDEMLSDEIVLLVMRRDGVSAEDVRAALRQAETGLRRRAQADAPLRLAAE